MPFGPVARLKLTPWLLLQPLDRMKPGQNTKSNIHGNRLENVQAPLVPEWVAVEAQSELDHAEDGSRLWLSV